jgi:DNA polymerase-3 subunit alpha
MAGLVEDFRWVTPQGRGPDRRYLRLDLSDQGGTFTASCFERELFRALVAACEAGTLLLLSAELSWREGDEAPRIALVGATPLAEAAQRTRLMLRVHLEAGAAGLAAIAALQALPRGGRLELRVEVPTAGGLARLRLARDIALAEGLVESLRRQPGIAGVALAPPESPPLRLVA